MTETQLFPGLLGRHKDRPEAQQLSLNARHSVCGKYISCLYRRNVHHANEPGSCEDGSYWEIRRSCLCLAPFIHLLRGPRARIVRPWVYGRRQVKKSARELMGRERLAERRYRTAARLRAGSEIKSRGEGLDNRSRAETSRESCVRSQFNQSQSGVGNNDLVSVSPCWVNNADPRRYTSFHVSGHQVVACPNPREQCVTPSKIIPLQTLSETSSFALKNLGHPATFIYYKHTPFIIFALSSNHIHVNVMPFKLSATLHAHSSDVGHPHPHASFSAF